MPESLEPRVELWEPRDGQPPWFKMMGWQAWTYAIGFTAIAIAESSGIHDNKKPQYQGDFIKRTISEFLWWIFCYHPDTYNARFARLRRLAFDLLCWWFPGHIQSYGKRY